MKASGKNQRVWLALFLTLGFGLGQPGVTEAQMLRTVFTNLHSFSSSDGAAPRAPLILSGNTLYGTTSSGGASGNGTIFALNINGTSFRTLHEFTGGNDGVTPGGLLLSGGTLYGTTSGGGTGGSGTIFSVDTNGDAFSVLYNFTKISGIPAPYWLVYSNIDGAYPWTGVVLLSNTLYGTATRGGKLGQGTLFSVNTNGTGFTNLYSFSAGSGPTGLLLASNILYGVVEGSGPLPSTDLGSIFSTRTTGGGIATLHAFTNVATGFWPNSTLVLLNGTLFGSTLGMATPPGRQPSPSIVFKVGTNGTGFGILHTFSTGFTNSDGGGWGGLVGYSNKLYGTSSPGGIFGSGTIFSLNTNGTEFTALYNFSALPLNLRNNDGATPAAPLIMSGNTLYGTASQGGILGNGTIFSLSFVPITAPVIIAQPLSRTNIAGTTASFGVTAQANVPLNYQWLKTATPLPQQTNSTLTLVQVSDIDAATYSVIVSNSAGSVTSVPAKLTVLDAPSITTQPLSQTNIAGTSAEFSVIATGTAPLAYQWLKGSAAISGQTTSTLTLSNVSTLDTGSYRVTITNTAGSVTSAATTLVVQDRPGLSFALSTTNSVLAWPIGALPFTPQYTTNLVAPTVWIPVSAQPIEINGQNVVSNPISAPQQFYRLKR